MKILIVGYFQADWHEPSWSKAFSFLGYQVNHFKFSDYISKSFLSRIQNRFLLWPLISKINSRFISAVANTNPDVILFYRSLLIKPEVIKRLKQEYPHVLFISYNNDNIFHHLSNKAYWRFFRKSIPFYDANFVIRSSDVSNYKLYTQNPVFLLHTHYLPWLHFNRNLKKVYDISFLGHFENDSRVYFLNYLMSNLEVTYNIRGSDWSSNSRGMMWKNLNSDEVSGCKYVTMLNQTKIALVFFSDLNDDVYTRRVFEIPACGTFMLCYRTDTMLELFKEDVEAVYFSTPQELYEKSMYYLNNDSEREKIALAGMKRAFLSGYDIISRAVHVSKNLEAISYAK